MKVMESKVFLALLHYPIYNKDGNKITTTITNLDLHDISRAGKSYNVEKYYVVNHLKSQQALVRKMRDYWVSDYGASYNSNRHEAFMIMEIANTLDEVIEDIKKRSGKTPRLIATDAREFSNSITYKDLREKIFHEDESYLIIFGTGWGLSEEIMKRCDLILEPIYGRGEFNHFSVRSAASIILDRLMADQWWE